MKKRRFAVDGSIRSSVLVSSIQTTETPTHWYIEVWSRGARSGTLVVNADDGMRVIDRLLDTPYRIEEL